MNTREKILEFLMDGKRTQREISLSLGSSRSRISEILSDLENVGLVRREKVSDRTVLVSINREKVLRVGMLKSSEYAAVVLALKRVEKAVMVRIRLYDNSLEALKDLLTGSLDLVASPLISSYFFYLIDNNIKPISGISKGGSGMLMRNNEGLLGTTPISSMERESRERKSFRLVYYKSIEDMLDAYSKKEVDAISIWEPYLSMFKGVKNPKEKGCCVLINSGGLTESARIFFREYKKIIPRMNSGKLRIEASEILSELLHVKVRDVLTSLDSYIFTTEIDKDDLREQIKMMGLPEDSNVDKFLERYYGISI